MMLFFFSLKATEVSGIKVLRFESTLYFGNVERFRNALYTVTGLDPNTEGQPKIEVRLPAGCLNFNTAYRK